MRNRACLWLLVAACGLPGCSRSEPGPVPEQLTLYSIDGRDFFPPERPPQTETDEKFHGHPVLGKVDLTTVADRRKLMQAYRNGVAESDGTKAACFWPRHGIRTVEEGVTTDYVICFECLHVHVHNSDTITYPAITDDPLPVFNEFLTEAGIPLAAGRLK